MKKRILALTLCLCTILTLFTGCGQQQPTKGDASGSGTPAPTSSISPTQTESVRSGDRKLNVSILQMPILDTTDSLEYLRTAVEYLMMETLRPELVIGVEYGLGEDPQRADSEFIEYLGAIAKKHHIYFIPGTFMELYNDLPEGEVYNSCPIFGPDGNLIDIYRKKAPYYPVEETSPSQEPDYCTFEIKEKGITVGVQICYDQFFPEISRTLALEGAELIVCPAYDPAEFDFVPDVIPRCRALENELFYIWTNGVNGPCGNSTIVDPEGQVIYKCDSTEMTYTTCLDFSKVTEKRLYGMDQHLNSLRYFNLDYPYAGRLNEAPVYQGWPELTLDPEAFTQRVSEIGVNTIPLETDTEMQAAQDARMDEIMRNLKG